MKTWDAIIIGAGIIGLSLALDLRKQGMSVLIVEKGEPGREASWAAGGMLADSPLEMPPELHELAEASARMYPEFVHELEVEAGLKIDLRDRGTILFPSLEHIRHLRLRTAALVEADLGEREPALRRPPFEQELELKFFLKERGLDPSDLPFTAILGPAFYLKERSVDPRHLTAAAVAAARHRGIDVSSGDQVLAIEISHGKVSGIRTNKTHFAAGIVVNCAGAWAGQVSAQITADGDTVGACVETGVPQACPEQSRRVQAEQSLTASCPIPTRPVKGQMLCVVMPRRELVRHVIRTPNVYLIPRSDGRLVIGATLEEAGFDKQTVFTTIQTLRQAAIKLVPQLTDARILEDWAGLRPGTPDKLPILCETSVPGYYAATGHFRDGILLAPITAKVMAQLISGQKPEFDLARFSVDRFRIG